MKTRDAVMLYQNTETDTKVETIDLNFTDPLSAINLEVQAANGATSNKGNFISDIATKIEVVDGSNVLSSLNMSQLEALHFYKTGKVPTMFMNEWASNDQRHNATLFFGRYLWDRDYALDPTVYSNPQLKITFNKAAVRAAGADAFAAGDTIKLTAVAKLMEGLTAPKQFLMQKQIDSFTSAASGDKRIDLPVDYDYRLLMLRAYVILSDIDEIIGNIKLTCDTDKYVLLDRKTKQLDAEAFAVFGACEFDHRTFFSDSDQVRLAVNKEPACVIMDYGDDAQSIYGIRWQWSSCLCPSVYTNASVVVNDDHKQTVREFGHALHATLPITFGLMNDPSTWFNPKAYSKFEMVLDQDAASGICEIVAEQVRPNALV